MDEDDDMDYSDIPEFAPQAQWAKGPQQLVTDISQLQDIFVPAISRETIIGQLWVEAMDRRGKNPIARIRALELIAELKGYKDNSDDKEEEDTDNLSDEEIETIAKKFKDIY